jgi:protein involved in polysaccharide export with SLBB domain
MISRFKALVAVMALACSACASSPPAEPIAATSSEAVYKLGAGDKLRITTFGEAQLSGDFALGDGGELAFPLLGVVPADKLTVAELRTRLENSLRDGYLQEPRVTVEVLTYRPYYVLGEVGKPGEYPYSSGLTVMNAVAAASGFTYRANTKKVFIKRAGLTAEEPHPLTAGLAVQPGDTIRVGERYF